MITLPCYRRSSPTLGESTLSHHSCRLNADCARFIPTPEMYAACERRHIPRGLLLLLSKLIHLNPESRPTAERVKAGLRDLVSPLYRYLQHLLDGRMSTVDRRVKLGRLRGQGWQAGLSLVSRGSARVWQNTLPPRRRVTKPP